MSGVRFAQYLGDEIHDIGPEVGVAIGRVKSF
jgi:hypothetical protein